MNWLLIQKKYLLKEFGISDAATVKPMFPEDFYQLEQ